MRSSSHVTRVYHNPRLLRSTVFHQRRNNKDKDALGIISKDINQIN